MQIFKIIFKYFILIQKYNFFFLIKIKFVKKLSKKKLKNIL